MERHIGSSLHSGHYTARIRVDDPSSNWMDFNDSTVSAVQSGAGAAWMHASHFASDVVYAAMFVRKSRSAASESLAQEVIGPIKLS